MIPLKLRGTSDRDVVRRLEGTPCIFLTQDEDFFDFPKMGESIVLLSHVPQRMPISERTRIWIKAMRTFFEDYKDAKHRLFEIGPDGEIMPWETPDDHIRIRRI